MLNPSLARRCATAAPIPRDEPVTIAVLVCTSFMLYLLRYRRRKRIVHTKFLRAKCKIGFLVAGILLCTAFFIEQTGSLHYVFQYSN
ncbi:hypothetical protein [Rubripirellula lacrimiformis]|uniref:hypothetical protein n=1 Tax=Rubripirellula lacrimiformis TaxID=1930273 RepID=UPI001C54CE2F|nr:hypothetical protein [Rubripirellula lacrimiformis]